MKKNRPWYESNLSSASQILTKETHFHKCPTIGLPGCPSLVGLPNSTFKQALLAWVVVWLLSHNHITVFSCVSTLFPCHIHTCIAKSSLAEWSHYCMAAVSQLCQICLQANPAGIGCVAVVPQPHNCCFTTKITVYPHYFHSKAILIHSNQAL